jgi:hypothetical protein
MAIQVFTGRIGGGKTYAPVWRVLLEIGADWRPAYHASAAECGDALVRLRKAWELYRLVQRKGRELGIAPRHLALPGIRAEIRRIIGVIRRTDRHMGMIAARAAEGVR